jgi:hypothetical protein
MRAMNTRTFSLHLIVGWSVLWLAAEAFAGNALVGHWRFNEASGDTAIDSSGLGNHGILTVIPGEQEIKPERVPGPPGFGGALSFTNITGGWQDDTNALSPLITAPAGTQTYYPVRR